MRLVDFQTYQIVTGDTTSASGVVEDAIDDATQAVEEKLRRQLPYGEYTESLPILDGRVYPGMIPLEVSESGTVDGYTIRGVFPDPIDWMFGDWRTGDTGTVTDVGGWTPDTLPRSIRDDICATAYGQLHPDASVLSGVPVGVNNAANGDVSLGWSSGYQGGVTGHSVVLSRESLKWRRR